LGQARDFDTQSFCEGIDWGGVERYFNPPADKPLSLKVSVGTEATPDAVALIGQHKI